MNVTWSAGAKRRCYSYGCAVVITEGSEAAASRARSSPVVLWRAEHKEQGMATGHKRYQVTVHVAWWVSWYLSGVALCSRITGLAPNEDKVRAVLCKGIRTELS